MNNIIFPTICAISLLPATAVAALSDPAPINIEGATLTIDYSKAVSIECEAGTDEWSQTTPYKPYHPQKDTTILTDTINMECRLLPREKPRYTKTSPFNATIFIRGALDHDALIYLTFYDRYSGCVVEEHNTGWGTIIVTGATFKLRR